MTAPGSVLWPGLSGRRYQYWVYPLGTRFDRVPGNYLFAREATPQRWLPCYIGQTENLQDRLGDHEKEACARHHGATHLHAHQNLGGEEARKMEEEDLIQQWQPPCNRQLKKGNS